MPDARKTSTSTKGPQLRLPTVVDVQPELVISWDQIGDYPGCHTGSSAEEGEEKKEETGGEGRGLGTT